MAAITTLPLQMSSAALCAALCQLRGAAGGAGLAAILAAVVGHLDFLSTNRPGPARIVRVEDLAEFLFEFRENNSVLRP